MTKTTYRRWVPLRGTLLALSVAVVLGGCSAPAPPTPPAAERIDLEGLWLVEPGPGTSYGSGGTTTLEFGPAPSGSATFLSRADANDILTCQRHIYAAISENVVLLDGSYYEAQTSGADHIELSNTNESVTLTRVTGSPPVPTCLEGSATLLQSFAFGSGSWTSLTAFESRLYFNTDQADNPIVGYDTVTGVLGPARINPGFHDHLVAARSDEEFYGHCACGNITSLARFDIANAVPLVTIMSTTDLAIFMSLEYGAFDGSSVLVGGRDYDHPGVNHVLTLHPDTLALESQRDVLPLAGVWDLAWTGTQLAALVNDSIVVIGADGRADATIDLGAGFDAYPVGLAAIGSSFYVLAETADDAAVLYEVAMP